MKITSLLSKAERHDIHSKIYRPELWLRILRVCKFCDEESLKKFYFV